LFDDLIKTVSSMDDELWEEVMDIHRFVARTSSWVSTMPVMTLKDFNSLPIFNKGVVYSGLYRDCIQGDVGMCIDTNIMNGELTAKIIMYRITN
jgi:hypothetical protein